jgi:RHH-type proline utilization regulon transcriptional repressor/proline dehydrogenase/delta 1-pyrroline-5-carboxylate dehydrogenase
VTVEVSRASSEPVEQFANRLADLGVTRVRVLGASGAVAERLRAAATTAGVHLATDPVTTNSRIEMLHYLREQAVSRTLHRYGNLIEQ